MADRSATPAAERVHIAFFGRRNAGKSSLVNALTGQSVAIVSPVAGTTTDPVRKSMELLPLGPVVMIDTPGLDDEGEVGSLRVGRALRELNRADIAVLVVDAAAGMADEDRALLKRFEQKGLPHLTVFNKCDLRAVSCGEGELAVSAHTGEGVEALKEALGRLVENGSERKLLGDLLEAGDLVLLVAPIDASAPRGRLILPQVRAIRDILDAHAACAVVQPAELPALLAKAGRPRLVITDSQAFGTVKGMVPEDVPLTSFSILFARFKGVLESAVRGAEAVSTLRDGDKVLICEGCTHHRQCEDIGTVKLPGWIRRFTGAEPQFAFTSGGDFPDDLSSYKLIVHCGGCMLTEREMRYRRGLAADSGVPFTNYGTLIAHMNGILRRSLEPFPEYAKKG